MNWGLDLEGFYDKEMAVIEKVFTVAIIPGSLWPTHSEWNNPSTFFSIVEIDLFMKQEISNWKYSLQYELREDKQFFVPFSFKG